MGHLRPSSAAPADGSLSPDSFRARLMLVTADSGQLLPSGSFQPRGQTGNVFTKLPEGRAEVL